MRSSSHTPDLDRICVLLSRDAGAVSVLETGLLPEFLGGGAGFEVVESVAVAVEGAVFV